MIRAPLKSGDHFRPASNQLQNKQLGGDRVERDRNAALLDGRLHLRHGVDDDDPFGLLLDAGQCAYLIEFLCDILVKRREESTGRKADCIPAEA